MGSRWSLTRRRQDPYPEDVTELAGGRPAHGSPHRTSLPWVVAILGWLYYLTPVFAGRVNGPHMVPVVALIAVPGAIAVAGLARRDRWPLGVALLSIVSLTVSPAGLGAAIMAQENLARGGGRRGAIPLVGAGMVLATILRLLLGPSGGEWRTASTVELTLCLTGVVVATLVGLLRTSLIETDAQRMAAELARADAQVAGLREARLAERELIAREMHDVVAHRLSLVAIHAGALAYRKDLLGDEARGTVDLIQDNAKAALDELRAMLTSLRGPEDPPEPPQPSLAALDVLIADAEAAGQAALLYRSGDFVTVPQRVSRHAFRIVQEGLTNARKHAPGAPVVVSVDVRADSVHVRVSNPVADLAPLAPGAGLGLLGVSERVALVGGSVTYGVRGDDEYVLEAVLPIEETT